MAIFGLRQITHQPHAYPSREILKSFQIIENTGNFANFALIFRICGVKVSKIQVEREGGIGGWWVVPSVVCVILPTIFI